MPFDWVDLSPSHSSRNACCPSLSALDTWPVMDAKLAQVFAYGFHITEQAQLHFVHLHDLSLGPIVLLVPQPDGMGTFTLLVGVFVDDVYRIRHNPYRIKAPDSNQILSSASSASSVAKHSPSVASGSFGSNVLCKDGCVISWACLRFTIDTWVYISMERILICPRLC